MTQQRNFTTGSVSKTLVRFTVPIVLTLLLQTLYSAVDLLIVGQFSTVSDVSGVTIGSQALTLLTGLCTGLAMGSTVLIGRKIGENDQDGAASVIQNSVVLFGGVALASMLVLLFGNNLLVSLLKTPTDAVAQTSRYLFVCTLGIPMIFAYNVLGSVFRGLGDSKTPLIAVTIACISNIFLDLLLVAGFNLGATGAAIATVIAQGISVVASVLIVKSNYFKFEKGKTNFHCIAQIFNIGLPIAIQSVLTTFSFVVLTVIVNQYNSVSFSAAVGVSEKLCGFIMLIPLAFGHSIAAYVAQNMGAGQLDRAKKSLYIGIAYSLSYGIIMAFLAFFYGDTLARVFTSDAAVLLSAKDYLRSYAFDTALVPIFFCMSGFFNGCGKTTFVMLQGVLSAIFMRIPLAYLFSLLYPASLFHIGLGTPITTFIQIFICLYYYKRIMRKSQLLCVSAT
ncbi:MAG: MATE family efflux transporter [Faecalibacterium sp.]